MVRLVFFAVAVLTLLTACGQGSIAGPNAFGGTSPLRTPGPGAITVAPSARSVVHADRRQSYMRPDAGKKSGLVYAGDWATNDVDVFDYATREQVGTLTGFNEPYGMCVDTKGDVYITNFGAATVVEYAHGGSKVLKTYNSVGEPIGCSVDAKNDVAVTSFSPGEVIIFAGGDPSKPTTYTGTCAYSWTMGYDDKNNLIGVGEEISGSTVACALLSGSKSMTTLSGCCSGPITIDFPGGTMWDGKYIALGDQEVGGKYVTGIHRATLSGTTLTPHGETTLADSCYSDYTDVVNPFIVGKKNTPVNERQGTVVVGPNLWCNDAGNSKIDFWPYPHGFNPPHLISEPPSEFYSAAVSLKS